VRVEVVRVRPLQTHRPVPEEDSRDIKEPVFKINVIYKVFLLVYQSCRVHHIFSEM
jgi:hypothetical protein